LIKTSIEIYDIGSEVFAVSRAHLSSDTKGVHNHLAIFPAIIDYVGYDSDRNITYGLTTPKGVDWGDTVLSKDVNHDFDTLINIIRKEWIKNVEKF